MLQIKAAVTALRSICRVPSLEDLQKDAASMDLFDLLQSFFGFQVINDMVTFLDRCSLFSAYC